MDQLEGAAMFPGEEHLVDPIFSVLDYVLGLRTVVCQISALHGLGHLRPHHPHRVERIIDRYLGRRKPAKLPWVESYAYSARAGYVQ